MTQTDSATALLAFQPQEQIELMNAIDSLRSQAINTTLDLPQIIVCGSQSSGKSSVLEAISKISFPAGESLTTKFATEIALRSADENSICVSFEPGPNTPGADRQRLRESSHEFQSGLGPDMHVTTVLKDAIERMRKISGESDFSPHRLRIQLAGPRQNDLTLVDLPGLIATTARATQSSDVELVRSMVIDYMHQPKSVILAVTPATIDPETQEVFKLARDADPPGSRTMGILTMPDRVQKGAERRLIDLVKNKTIKFDLGWHVLKNPNTSSDEESSLHDRDCLEDVFFNGINSPWNVLADALRGVTSLRPKLGKILFQHISGSLPTLTKTIDNEILVGEKRLTALGPARSSHNEQLRYLERLCTQLNALIAQGIDATYEEDFFREADGTVNEAKLLRTTLRTLYDNFAADMAHNGCQYHVAEQPIGNCAHHDRAVQSANITLSPTGRPQCVSRDAMVEAIFGYVSGYRGRELPNELPERATREVFRILSSPWEHIARAFGTSCLETAKRFFGLVLHSTAPTTAHVIMDEVISPYFVDAETKLNSKISEVLSPFRKLSPFTKNPGFSRHLFALTNALNIAHCGTPQQMQLEVNVNTILALYEVSEGTFIDNMIMLAVENCVVQPLRTMFTTQTILELEEADPEKFTRIASEPQSTELEREELRKKLRVLKDARSVCNKHAFYQAQLADTDSTDASRSLACQTPRSTSSTSPIPRIQTPQPEEHGDLLSTRGDPVAFTPPRTPDSSSRNPRHSTNGTSPARRNASSGGIFGASRQDGGGFFGPHRRRAPTPSDEDDEAL